MEKHQINFDTFSCHQHGWLFQYPETPQNSGSRLVLLHGAGVAGEVTWTYIANYLDQWQELLIIDLAGMGGSSFHSIQQPMSKDFAVQVTELLEALDWTEFDLAGYSFGGMVAHHFLEQFYFSLSGLEFEGLLFLIEPAMLFSSEITHLQQKADEYSAIADAVVAKKGDVETYRQFLDSVSPARRPNPVADELTMKRLQENSAGFSAALKAVSVSLKSEGENYVNWCSPYPGLSFVGGLSVDVMKQRHQRLTVESVDWQYIEVPNSDHSLVFTKPRTIAKSMNQAKANKVKKRSQSN